MTSPAIPQTMRAAAIERFGGPEVIALRTLPVPGLGPDEVLVRVEAAGVASWDAVEREGGLTGMMPGEPRFPYVLGSDGAGTVAAVGERVSRVRVGERVYAFGFLNPKGGFYAEYAAVKADDVSPIPEGMPIEQAGTMPSVAMTALRGLDDTLGVRDGERVLVFGASGGVGHLAVQLAQRMGARVLAVASGEDGVALVRRLGADAAVDGRGGDVAEAARAFAPDGLDAALVLAGGEELDDALAAVRDGGRVAYPSGVEPKPRPRDGVACTRYEGMPDPDAIRRLDRLIAAGPFTVHVPRTFPLEEATEAHRALEGHHLGKFALRVSA